MSAAGMKDIFETAKLIGCLAPYLDSLKRTEAIKPYQSGSSTHMSKSRSQF